MTNQEIKLLQNVISDNTYSESVINKALEIADSLEVKICLKALRKGICTFESRMILSDFVVRLEA